MLLPDKEVEPPFLDVGEGLVPRREFVEAIHEERLGLLVQPRDGKDHGAWSNDHARLPIAAGGGVMLDHRFYSVLAAERPGTPEISPKAI